MKNRLYLILVLCVFFVGCTKEEKLSYNKNLEYTKTLAGEEEEININSQNKDKIDNNSKAEDIRKNYEQKVIEYYDAKSTTSGISKYNNLLIETLRSYNIEDVESGKVVYELSEMLLTDIYNFYKENWDEKSFTKLKSEQVVWVNEKIDKENSLSNDELVKYKTLSKMTIDRCEVLNSYYNNNIFYEN